MINLKSVSGVLSLVLGITAAGGTAYKGVDWANHHFALAADVQQMNATLLMIRRDQLATEERYWQQRANANTLTEVEWRRWNDVKWQIHQIDEQLLRRP